MKVNNYNNETRIIATNYNMPLKEDMNKLLDKRILLNTYIKGYFVHMGYVSAYDICYQVNCFDDKQDLYLEAQTINFDDERSELDNALYINELVYINTETKDKEPNRDFGDYEYIEYDYTYIKLLNNLEKEVSKN